MYKIVIYDIHYNIMYHESYLNVDELCVDLKKIKKEYDITDKLDAVLDIEEVDKIKGVINER